MPTLNLFGSGALHHGILGSFDKATRWLSGSNYPTLNNAVQVDDYLLDELECFLGRRNDEEKGLPKAAIVDRCDAGWRRGVSWKDTWRQTESTVTPIFWVETSLS